MNLGYWFVANLVGMFNIRKTLLNLKHAEVNVLEDIYWIDLEIDKLIADFDISELTDRLRECEDRGNQSV